MTRPTLTLAASLLGAAVPAAAELRTFPGCGATLQACLDASTPGDVIRLAADLPAAEVLEVPHGLTLESAPGLRAAIPAGSLVAFIPTGAATLTLRGLTIHQGGVNVRQAGSGAATLIVEDVHFVGRRSLPAVQVDEAPGTEPLGPVRAVVRGSVFDLPADGNDSSTAILVLAQRSAAAEVAIERNRIDISGSRQGDAIRVRSEVASAVVDVVANAIVGTSYHSGVDVEQVTPGTSLTARMVGNVVAGQRGASGHAGALTVVVREGTSGDLLLANNTLVDNRTGIQVFGDGALRGVLANNLVAFTAGDGLDVDQVLEPGLVARRNVAFANGVDHLLPGDPPLVVDPRLAADGSFRPADDSPLRDAGATDVLPADLLGTDLAGTPRLVGPAVDVGAFELPCPDGRLTPGTCADEPPAACDPATCDDGDPCTADACGPVGCVHEQLAGFAAALCTCERPVSPACAGQRIPRTLRKRHARACTLLARAAEARPAAATRLVRRSIRAFDAARRAAAGRRARRTLARACRAAFGAGLADASSRARVLVPDR